MSVTPLEKDTWYRLVNLGWPRKSLDVINDGKQETDGNLQIANTGDFSGQHWQLRPSKTHLGYFNLVTLWLGTGRALDVHAGDKTRPHLAKAGDATGQQWQLISLGGNVWRLTNLYSGSELFLSSDESGERVKMEPRGGDSHQRWTLVKIRGITEPGFGNN
ncbi:ricin B lectin domain-containing protein [Cercophora newfieldiana]|uniref:Ricin B lectin domain-containing protein n=1 Tax=Cercophora newfieldiana TaxID=92897 RepID=A0AA39Y512_9PEZI|nr:ricin B lectin domain-containing protein [Cercophora newfieldiana]